MEGDKKGKGKAVIVAKKKRSRDEREWDQALAAADAVDQPQCSVRIRGSEAEAERQGEPEDTPQLHRSARTRTSETAQPTPPPCGGHGPEGVQLRGKGLTRSRSSRQRVTHRLGISPEVTVPQSPTWLISLISEGCRRTRSGNFDLSLLRSCFRSREPNVDRRFYTRIQMAFYYAYCQLGVRFSEHRRLD